MGNYLPSPVTEKKTIEGGGNGVTYVSSCV